MKKPLKMQENMGNAWVLVSRNVWPPHTPPGTATIDGGSTELHPRRPTPPTPPLAPPRTAPPPRQQPHVLSIRSAYSRRPQGQEQRSSKFGIFLRGEQRTLAVYCPKSQPKPIYGGFCEGDACRCEVDRSARAGTAVGAKALNLGGGGATGSCCDMRLT
jgi:hypothetical protein